MEKNLFDKAILFTDIHFGLSRDSTEHNEDCLAFIDWMISEAKRSGIKTCLFLGDYFHNRNAINVRTLDYGLQGVRKLSEYFDDVWMLVGNHDMTNRHKRDTTSINFSDEFPNVHLVNKITDVGNCSLVPFMVGDEWTTLKDKNPKYFFGHFELPGYKLNSLVEMPDTGREQDEMFKCDILFSGHFHKRQMRTTSNGSQIIYIGNCFPHNFSDAWDDARGVVKLEWGGVPSYHNWDKAPKYRTANMSDVLEDPEYFLGEKVNIKVTMDVGLTIEEQIFIKDTYTTKFKLKNFNIVQTNINSVNIDQDSENSEVQAHSVDAIIAEQINNIDSTTLEKALLLEIYNNL